MKTNPETLPAQLREYNAWRRGNETLDQPSAAWVGAVIDAAADRLEWLERDLASKDAHADEIYKAAVDLAKKLEDDLAAERDQIEANHKATELIEDMLYAERALADRLAGWLDTLLSGYDDAKEIAPFDVTEHHSAGRALKAWREARNDT